MSIDKFITALLPADGNYCVVGIKSNCATVQRFVKTIQALEEEATKLYDEDYNVYFACAKYASPTNRKAKNVHSVQSYWLDVDCYDDKPYADQKEAIVALKKFCETCKLPKPTIVDSGRGIHVYWGLDAPVEPSEWKATADKLKAACHEHDFKADPARTADIASILRLPNTLNYKTNPPTAVTLLTIGKPTTQAYMAQCLGVVSQPRAEYDNGGINELTKSLMGNKKSKFSNIIGKGCEQIDFAYKNQEQVKEPLWRAVLSIAKHCVDAPTAIHEVSRHHPNYDPIQTEDKASKTLGPYKCDWFEKNDPSKCANCEHKGKIGSPIVLGRFTEEADTTDKYDIPKLPFPYFLGNNGAIYRKSVEEDADATLIYEHCLYVVKRMRDPQNGEVVWLRLHTPKDGVREFALSATDLLTTDRLRERLAWYGVMALKKQMDSIMQYIVYFVKELQCRTGAELMRNQFGWTDRHQSFIVGDVEILANSEKYSPPSSLTKDYCSAFGSKGTLEEWKKIINVYNQPGFEPHAFAFFTAFGAPLIKHINLSGAIINLVNDESGTGKTTSLKCMHSVYGHPEEMMLMSRDTANTRYHRLGVMNNLPLGCDEITKMSGDEFSDFAYAVSQGRGRGRMKMNVNEERMNFAKWATIMVCSSNASVVDKLKTLGTSDGELMRVLEFTVPSTKLLSKEKADTIYSSLYSNYGMAGKIYLQDLVANLEERIKAVSEVRRLLDRRANFSNRERYWSGMVACNIAGALVARSLGLHDIDVRRVFDWLILEIRAMRMDSAIPLTNSSQIIADFWNRYRKNTLIINGELDRRSNVEALPILEPFGELVVRYEPDTKLLFIDCSYLRKYCQEYRINIRSLIRNLTKEKVYVETVNKRMSKGTKLGNIPAQAAYVLDCNEGTFIDTDALISDVKEETANEPCKSTA